MSGKPRTRVFRLFRIAAGASLMCWLAACSSSSNSGSSAASAKPVDPCSTLNAADIQMALGVAPMGEGKRENLGLVDSCTWNLPAADLSVSFYNATGAATSYAPTLSSRRSRDKTYAAVSGVGSQAVYRDDSFPPGVAISASVEVVQGNRHFDVHYVDSEGKAAAPSQDALVSLAKTVLTHAH